MASENAVKNAQNQQARKDRQEAAKAEDRRQAEKTARFGGCRV